MMKKINFSLPLYFKPTAVLAALALAFALPVQADDKTDFQRANAAYDQGNYAEAKPVFEALALKGYASAQYNLGLMYNNGNGVAQNYAVARQWYEKAAAQV